VTYRQGFKEITKIGNVFNGRVQQFLTASSERWLIYRNEDASKKIFVATENLLFDFEFFIGDQFTSILHVSVALSTNEGGWWWTTSGPNKATLMTNQSSCRRWFWDN